MADFWVSQQKHWCKYCKKFVYNNKISIERHENGPQHKQNIQRYLSDVYKRGKQEKKEAESVRRELQRIEKAAHLSMAKGGSSGIPASITGPASAAAITTAAPQASKAASSRPAQPRAYIPPPPSLEMLKSSGPKREGRDEWAMPKEQPKEEKVGNDDALVGQWQVVATPTKPTADKPRSGSKSTAKADPAASSTMPHDEKLNDDDEDQQEDLTQFKIKEKEFPTDALTLDDATADIGATLFKKRKLGDKAASRKKMNIRKKE
ncbi:hypothetical protein DM01DRAFT_1336268 [Hesseltinella vesiculosa]|uniref:Matrin-type domain-containing protein n=1 Tax=Hesseltinella vesiculosa TaxID=101127 RepID=A0A1X2GG97_9FUNG|nr:hypothetical protein DM01DRAFT_1336268 [Hesseltinella vesiculosa]